MPTPKKSSKSAKTPAKSADKSAAPSVAPAIDLSHAAGSVAASLAARAKSGAAASTTAGLNATGDSASFKKFKEGIAKPQFSSTSPLAGSGHDKKFQPNSAFNKSTGHGQAGGANVARTGVPRRTSGG